MEKNCKTCKHGISMDKVCKNCKHGFWGVELPKVCLSCKEGEFWEPKEAMKLNWIEWNGGECPVPDGHDVSVRFSDGEVRRDALPELWRWERDNNPDDIVAYYDHTAAEQEEPKEWKDGLPPIGYTHKEVEKPIGWHEKDFKVVAHVDGVFDENGDEFCAAIFCSSSLITKAFLPSELKPIKSQAEKEREEARQIEIDMFNAMLEQEDIYLQSPDSENDRANMEFVIGEYLLKRLAGKADS